MLAYFVNYSNGFSMWKLLLMLTIATPEADFNQPIAISGFESQEKCINHLKQTVSDNVEYFSNEHYSRFTSAECVKIP